MRYFGLKRTENWIYVGTPCLAWWKAPVVRNSCVFLGQRGCSEQCSCLLNKGSKACFTCSLCLRTTTHSKHLHAYVFTVHAQKILHTTAVPHRYRLKHPPQVLYKVGKQCVNEQRFEQMNGCRVEWMNIVGRAGWWNRTPPYYSSSPISSLGPHWLPAAFREPSLCSSQ